MNLLIWAAYGLSGWLTGLAVNYLADVLPIRRTLTRPYCWKCAGEIPITDYFIFLKRCQHCYAPRQIRFWLVELIMTMLSLLFVVKNPLPMNSWLGLILLGYLLLVTIIDLEHRLILHVSSLAGGMLCLGAGIWLHGTWATVMGGLIGASVMLGLYFFGLVFVRWLEKIRGQSMAEQEAIGFGDVTLSGVVGLLLGWPGISLGLLLAVILGGAVSLMVLIWNAINRTFHTELAVPYGPFLTISAFILLFVKNWLS